MGIRDKMRARIQPLLEPGETIKTVFPVQFGLSPWVYSWGAVFGMIGGIVMLVWVKPRIVVVTDRSVVVFTSSKWIISKPKQLLGRFPLDTPIPAPVGKLWGHLEIGGWKFYVHRRFFKDVQAASA